MIEQFNLSPEASDQLRETTEQVNLKLRLGEISMEEATALINQARLTEGMSKYLGLPLEEGSAQTLELEGKRASLMKKVKRRRGVEK